MKHAIITLISFLLLCLPLNAVQRSLAFIPLSLDEGLTHPKVQCIFRDHTGVVWIGTKNGLNSWDQSELKSYLHNPSDPNSLPDNYIKFIVEGTDNKLYLSTNHGVGIFDAVLKRFTPILYKGKMLEAWGCLRSDSLLLLGGRETIYAYNYHTQSLVPMVGGTIPDSGKYINHISVWDAHKYIVSTKSDGVWMYDLKRRDMSRCPFVQERNINTIFVDSRGCLYVSVYGSGVFRYKHDGTPAGHFTTRNDKLTHDVVSCFVEKDNVIWMGTDGGGINLLDLRTDKTECIRHIPDDSHSLPNNSIFSLYKDDKGNIWGGSVHGGLFAIIKNHIKTYKDVSSNDPHGLSERTITALYEDADTLLWIGTDGGGLNMYNQHTGLFRHYPSTSSKKVVSITSFSPRVLLLSCFDDGFYLFDKYTARLTPIPLLDEGIVRREFTYGDLINLYASSGEIYIFGYNTYVHNMHTHQVRKLSVSPSLAMNAQPICTDKRYIYILSYRNLLQIEKDTKEATSLFSVSGNESLTSACMDSQGDFWIGSESSLYHYNMASHKVQKVQNVLLHNIQSLVSDNKNRIWIGANNMLLCYLIDEKRTVILDETDGAKPNGYIFTPMPRSFSKNIYIGGTQGLTVIDKDIEISGRNDPTIDLLSVCLDGKDITHKVMRHGRLTVPYKHSSISFKVIVDESIPFRKHLFNYILEGNETRKIQSKSRTMELGTLKPGNYTLLACCSTNNNWNEAARLLTIHVQSPVWQRTWFICICILVFISICMVGVRLLQKRMNRKLKLALAKSKREQEENLRFITRLNDIIDNNMDKPSLDNQFLQNEMGMGRTSLYYKIKQITGMGMNEYINKRKIEKAENLLKNTSLSISEISDRLGFTYQRYFSTIFKKIKGVSPSQYRNRK